MELMLIGPDLYGQGTVFKAQAATMFPGNSLQPPGTCALVTLGETHWQNREQYRDWLKRELDRPLTAAEWDEIVFKGVDLVVQSDLILIRPNPEQMDRVMQADALLQTKYNKFRIRFQLISDKEIFPILLQLGELWRIAAPVLSNEEMKQAIRETRMALGGRAIYYYSAQTGCRLLTFNEFSNLAHQPDQVLYQHLVEIQTYCSRQRHRGGWELDFFPKCKALRAAMKAVAFPANNPAALRAEHARLVQLFKPHVHPRLMLDDGNENEWVCSLYSALFPLADDVTELDKWLGLAVEFRKHIKWLPGGRLKKGHLDFDPVFDCPAKELPEEYGGQNCRRARAIILNFARDYGDLEFINVGWINESLSRSGRPERGRRDVYVVVFKRASEEHLQMRMLRMQKWDMGYRLDRRDDQEQYITLQTAMFQTEEYTEYTQDRYLGCRRLGMNLFGPVRVGKLSENYQGVQRHLHEVSIWTPYFDRAYVRGTATDTISKDCWQRQGYMERFAELLGEAAAPNLIVGRGDGDWKIPDEKLTVFFDDGDEVIVERDGLPVELVVMHHTGSFWHFGKPLERFATAYARPLEKRKDVLPDRARFAEIYLDAMMERFVSIQQEYELEKHAFVRLFQIRRPREEGNFAHRWTCVLNRLQRTDPEELRQAIAEKLAKWI